jgi:hypothetical protein
MQHGKVDDQRSKTGGLNVLEQFLLRRDKQGEGSDAYPSHRQIQLAQGA